MRKGGADPVVPWHGPRHGQCACVWGVGIVAVPGVHGRLRGGGAVAAAGREAKVRHAGPAVGAGRCGVARRGVFYKFYGAWRGAESLQNLSDFKRLHKP